MRLSKDFFSKYRYLKSAQGRDRTANCIN